MKMNLSTTMLFPHPPCEIPFVVSPTSTVTSTRHTLRLSPSSALSRAIFILTMLSSTLAKNYQMSSTISTFFRCLAFCPRLHPLPSKKLGWHWIPSKICIPGGWKRMCPGNGAGPKHRRIHPILLAKKGRTDLLKTGLIQDVRLSGARHAFKDRAVRPQLINTEVADNEPFLLSGHLKTTILRPSPMIRLSKTIPRGSNISIIGRSMAKTLRRVWNQTCLITRTINSLLRTSRSTLAPLPHRVSGTIGSQPGTNRKRDILVSRIGPSSRVMTGLFSRTTYTSPDLVTLELLHDILDPVEKLYFNLSRYPS